MKPSEREVTVCAACLRASCWHGEFMCDLAQSADVRRVRVSDLRRLKREHPSYFSAEKVRAVTGSTNG